MSKYVLLIDSQKCNGCYNCFMACKDEHSDNPHTPWSAKSAQDTQLLKMHCMEHGGGYKIKTDFWPAMCRHCENPACASAAPEGAVFKREDGIVCFNNELIRGHKEVVEACPYGAISWDEETQLPLKCMLCVHMLENGERTVRCAESCPTGALIFGDADDPESEAYKLLALPENSAAAACGDVVRFLNLPRPFIAGEVLRAGDPDCAENAYVSLTNKSTGETVYTKTDIFGDFQFTGLTAGTVYTIAAHLEGYDCLCRDVRLEKSVNIGELILNPARNNPA